MGSAFRFDTHLMQAFAFKRKVPSRACNLGQVIQSSRNSGYPAELINESNRETGVAQAAPPPVTEARSSFSPGPMDEEMDNFLT